MPRRMSKMARMEIMRPDRTREAESRFRDRRGREHYDYGRFAPMRNDTNIEIEGRFRDDRGGERFENRYLEPMRGAESGEMNYRAERQGGGPMNYDPRWDSMERRGGGRMEHRGDGQRSNYGESRYPYGPFPIYRDNAGMRGGGYEMNQIGFDAEREMDGGRYRMDAGYEMRNEMDRRPGAKMSGGYAYGEEKRMEPLTKESAERWVHSMKGASGMPGQHWTMDQAKQIMTRHGYQDDPMEFYVALNMMKSDYVKVAQKMGVDREEFYACMADAFLNDEDAHEDKLARYRAYIVKD